MNLIIVPGNSSKNEKWLKRTMDHFSGGQLNVKGLFYQHWQNGGEFIDLQTELEKLIELAGPEENLILAKSAGAMLVVYAVHTGQLRPERCVFMGLPLKWAKEHNLALGIWLQSYRVPTTILQKTDDPVTSFAELESSLADLGQSSMRAIELAGADHRYDELEIMEKYLLSGSEDK